MDHAPTVAVYRFAGFVLDIGKGKLLTAADEEIPLRRQSFEMLRLFSENAGRLLDRESINRAIWPDVTVTDDSLTQCVRDIRRALRDEAQRMLKTVPRRGYMFSPDVLALRDPPAGLVQPVLALPDRPSLVVLPFQNMSGEPEQGFFVDGLVEDITTALSCIRSLFVIARNSAFAYRDRSVDVRRIGHDLGVRYALEGSVRRNGNRLRVTTQLIDASSGVHVWAERYDRDLSDVFAMQGEIATSVAGVIEPQWPVPSSSGSCGSRRSGWMPGRPTSEDSGTSPTTGGTKTRLRGRSFNEPSRSIRNSRLGTTATHWPCSGRSGTTRRAPSRRYRPSRSKRR